MRKLLLTAIIPITLVAGACRTGQTLWAACEPTNNPWGTDGTWVLVCQNGEWKPTMLVTEYAQLLQGKTVSPFAPLPTKPTTPTTTTTAAPTTTSTTTTTAPLQAPQVTGISRPAGTTDGGQVFELAGSGFTGVTSVTIGGVAATSVVVVDDDTITGVTGAHPTEDVVDVVVTNPAGSDTLVNEFEYIDTPTIVSITPNTGPAAGGTSVTISGTDFSGSTFTDLPEVNFEATPGVSVALVNATTITVTTPAGFDPGDDASVTVNTWAGTSNIDVFSFT